MPRVCGREAGINPLALEYNRLAASSTARLARATEAIVAALSMRSGGPVARGGPWTRHYVSKASTALADVILKLFRERPSLANAASVLAAGVPAVRPRSAMWAHLEGRRFAKAQRECLPADM